LVTEPEELAIGFAVALTPPTSVANEGVAAPNKQTEISLRTDLLCL
jgi:hypothetical protein